MKSVLTSLVLLLGLQLPLSAAAESEAGEQALRELGALNGLALECGYVDQVRRMKQAVVDSVPKTRYYGSLFEEATNQGFLEALKAKRPCPTEVTLEAQVDEAVATLARSFE